MQLYAHFYDARDGDRHATRGPFGFLQLTYALLRADADAEVAAYVVGLWMLLPDAGDLGYTDVVISDDPRSGFSPPEAP